MKKVKLNRAFLITMGFFFFFFTVFGYSSSSNSNIPAWKKEINDIDNKISQLEEIQRGYKSKAISHANQADRLQFKKGELQTAKRHWKLAKQNKQMVKEVQIKIDELKIQKQNIFKKNN